MHLEFGVGRKKIVYLNVDQTQEVSNLFENCYRSYQRKHDMTYPDVFNIFHKSTILLTDHIEQCQDAFLCIGFDLRDPGIYVDGNAYRKQIAQKIRESTGMQIHDSTLDFITVGIGRSNRLNYNNLIIKDAMFLLPEII